MKHIVVEKKHNRSVICGMLSLLILKKEYQS